MLYIEGGTKSQQKLSKELYAFFSQEMQIKKPIDVDLRIQDIEDAQAWTDHEGDGKFYIDIEKDLNTDQFITAFFHEMVHVIQHLRNKPISEKEAYKLESKFADKFILLRDNG